MFPVFGIKNSNYIHNIHSDDNVQKQNVLLKGIFTSIKAHINTNINI